MARVCPCHGKEHLFDVVLLCTDGTAIGYHVDTYADLIQSLIDVGPSFPTTFCSVGLVRKGRLCADAFMVRVLRDAGLRHDPAPVYGPITYSDAEGFCIDPTASHEERS